MISAKMLFSLLFILLFASVGGFILEVFQITFGRYIAYVAVPIGAIVVMIGGIAALFGKVKNDLRE